MRVILINFSVMKYDPLEFLKNNIINVMRRMKIIFVQNKENYSMNNIIKIYMIEFHSFLGYYNEKLYEVRTQMKT